MLSIPLILLQLLITLYCKYYSWPLKPDSAPVRGDGYKPTGLRIQQSQHRDVCTVAQRQRYNMVVVRKIFLLRG